MLCFLAVSRSLGLFDHAEPLSLSAQHGRAPLDSCPFLISLSLPPFSCLFSHLFGFQCSALFKCSMCVNVVIDALTLQL